MNNNKEKAISLFFKAVNMLQSEDIIKGKDYLNDIYKAIAYDLYGYHFVHLFSNNCPKSHPCIVNTNFDCENILIALGPLSNLKYRANTSEIHYYIVSKKEMIEHGISNEKQFVLDKEFFKNKSPDKIYELKII